MIESIHFKNFKVLRDTMLPLDRFTLIVGPNGSGKSTALQALRIVADPKKILVHLPSTLAGAFGLSDERMKPQDLKYDDVVSKTPQSVPPSLSVEIKLRWAAPFNGTTTTRSFRGADPSTTMLVHHHPDGSVLTDNEKESLDKRLARIRIYALRSEFIKLSASIQEGNELDETGANLVAVLDALDDQDRDRFDQLQQDFLRWLPEFDQIAFDRSSYQKSLALRLRGTSKKVPAHDISDGTLFALALLTLTHLPAAPTLVGLEEPDRGIHPRLLRDVRDALYRLAYPEDHGEKRPPVQVIATTHSPYMVDLFKDHPEQIVIADKVGNEAKFTRLTDIPNWQDILGDAALGEAWYTGALGGVPSGT